MSTDNIQSYKLPVCDVDTEKRNFPGYAVSIPYSLAEMQQGDESGTTETDSKTAPKSGGYSNINSK